MERKIDRIYFELTTMCNLRCKHCFNYNENFKAKYLSLDEIRFFYEKVKNRTNGIVLTGGEPFLHPQIKEILELLKSERVVITTNGTLYSPDYYENMLKENSNVFLQISFDGMSKAVYEEVRGPHTYDKVRQLIEYLSERRFGKQIGLSMSILACNIHEVFDVIHYAERCKLHSIHFPTLIIEGRCASDVTILPEVKELNLLEDQLLKETIENENLHISINTLNRIAGWVTSKEEMDCLLNATIKVTPEGELMPCPVAWRKSESIGHISEITDYGELIEKLNAFSMKIKEMEKCGKYNASKYFGENFCEYCSIRNTEIVEGIEYRCKNYMYHMKNIIKERMNQDVK